MESKKYTQEETDEMMKRAKERSECISRALYEFNRMLQREEKSREECYKYLFEKEREIGEKYNHPCTFEFLYPEWIFKAPDTYEEYKEQMNKLKTDSEDISNCVLPLDFENLLEQ